MKFTAVAFVAAAAAAVSAQGIADIPACAQTCLLPALQATGCSLTDFKCSCSNKKFVTDSTACIQKSCSAADVEKAAKATYELCKAAGVEIETQPPVAPSTTAAQATSSAAPEPTTKSEEPTTAAPSSASYETEAPSSYVPAPTTVHTTTSAGNATQPTTPPAYTGGAVAIAGNVALAVGGVAAAFLL